MAPGILQNYLTPTDSVHALYNMAKPAVGPMLTAVRHGLARMYADKRQGLRDKRARLPVAALLRIINVGRTTPDAALRRRIAGPGGGANLRLKDVTLATSHLLI